MAGKTSKTSAAAMRTTKVAGKFEPSADVSRVISCAGGTYAYVLTLDGRSVHAAVGSEEMIAALGELRAHPGIAAKMSRQIGELDQRYPATGWAAAWAATEPAEEPAAA